MPTKSPFNANASYEEATKLPKECAVRNIINTSVQDGKMSLNNESDLAVLEECFNRESSLQAPRKSITKPLAAKIKKLKERRGYVTRPVQLCLSL